jgi:alpha-L-rhamnosidase
MNRPFSSFLFFQSVLMASFLLNSCNINEPALESNAQWITVPEFRDSSLENSWIAFSKTFKLQDIPDQALARIAADTKYWLWLNDSLIVREGGLKWGPSPKGYYEDEVTLGNYLKKGENIITC